MKVWSAAELMSTEFPPPTAAELVDLVDSGACTATCLFGLPYSNCQCRCGEQFHGAARQNSPALIPRPITCDCLMLPTRIDSVDQDRPMFMAPTHWKWAGRTVEASYRCEWCGQGAVYLLNPDDMVTADVYGPWVSKPIRQWRAEARAAALARNRASG